MSENPDGIFKNIYEGQENRRACAIPHRVGPYLYWAWKIFPDSDAYWHYEIATEANPGIILAKGYSSKGEKITRKLATTRCSKLLL